MSVVVSGTGGHEGALSGDPTLTPVGRSLEDTSPVSLIVAGSVPGVSVSLPHYLTPTPFTHHILHNLHARLLKNLLGAMVRLPRGDGARRGGRAAAPQ